MLAGLKLAVAPVGRLLALYVTVAPPRFVKLDATVYVAWPPAPTELVTGVTVMLKSGVGAAVMFHHPTVVHALPILPS
jgi:hypothetical protein